MRTTVESTNIESGNRNAFKPWVNSTRRCLIGLYDEVFDEDPTILGGSLPAKYLLRRIDLTQDDPAKMTMETIFEVPGQIISFINVQESRIEVGFNPDLPAYTDSRALGLGDIYVYSMLSVFIDGTWEDVIITKDEDIEFFSDGYMCKIDKIDQSKFVSCFASV